jgi:hypothetical protein
MVVVGDGGGKCVGAWVVLVVLVVGTGREGMFVLIHGDILGGFHKLRGQVPAASENHQEN